MFKRYKSGLEQESTGEGTTAVFSNPGQYKSNLPSRPFRPPEAPPRIFDDYPTEDLLQAEPEVEPCEDEEPETTLGEGVVFRGELSFQRLLRIDGCFEGELLSEGKLIIGPKGLVKSNVHMKEAVIDGRVEGNLYIKERLELRGEASVHGDIIARSLTTDEGVTIVGHVQVTPNGGLDQDLETSNPCSHTEPVPSPDS